MPLIRKPLESRAATAPDAAAVLTALASGTEDERWAAARAAPDLPDGIQALGTALVLERSARVREAQQVTVRPTIARLVLRELESEVLRRLVVEPCADCAAHTTTPTTEALRVLREVHQVKYRGLSEEQRSTAAKQLSRLHAVSMSGNLLSLIALIIYTWRVTNPSDQTRFLSAQKFRG